MRDDSPSGGVGAFPEGDVVGSLSGEVADFFAEVGDGSGFGGAQRSARVAFFKFSHGVCQERSKGAGVFEIDCLQGEAALLIELADISGGELSSFRSGVFDDGDTDPVAVTDEGCFEGAELLEVTQGVVGTEDDECIGFGDPVVGEITGDFHEFFEAGRDFKIGESIRGKLEAIFCSKDESVEE